MWEFRLNLLQAVFVCLRGCDGFITFPSFVRFGSCHDTVPVQSGLDLKRVSQSMPSGLDLNRVSQSMQSGLDLNRESQSMQSGLDLNRGVSPCSQVSTSTG